MSAILFQTIDGPLPTLPDPMPRGFPMSSLLLVAACIPPVFWGMNIWGGWAQKGVELNIDPYHSALWLRIVGAEPDRSNRIKFIRRVSFALLTIYLLAAGGLMLILYRWP